jgi:hypothetical protein
VTERLAVASRLIKAIGYDNDTSTLEIEFIAGDTYQYFMVRVDVYRELMSAESIGGYYLENIRDKYPFHRDRASFTVRKSEPISDLRRLATRRRPEWLSRTADAHASTHRRREPPPYRLRVA